jgi:predicted small secreted protein
MRHHSLAALLAALALTLAACNGGTTEQAAEDDTDTDTPVTEQETPEPDGDVDEDALERIADAAQNTIDEGTARFTIEIETAGTAGQDGTQPVTVEGEEDFDAELRRMTFEGPQGELDMIVEGTTMYIELPATEDEQWLRLELEELVQGEAGFGGPGGVPSQNPRDNLEILSAAARDAQEAGEEDVDGETTTRYDLVIDLDQAADTAEPDTEEALERMRAQTGVQTFDMSVWVDEDDRIRRISYTLDLGQAQVEETTEEGEVEADPQGEITVTVDYFDFGGDVNIEVPDDDQVIDADEEQIRRSFQQADQMEDGGTTGTTDDS